MPLTALRGGGGLLLCLAPERERERGAQREDRVLRLLNVLPPLACHALNDAGLLRGGGVLGAVVPGFGVHAVRLRSWWWVSWWRSGLGVSGGVVRRLPPSGEQDALALGAVEGVATGVPFLVAAAPAVLAGAPGGDRVGGPVLTAVVHEVREAFGGLGGGEIGRAHV